MFNRRILELPFYLPAVQAFRRLTGSLKCAFLDSSLSNNLGRYSIIGIQPYLKLVKNADAFLSMISRKQSCPLKIICAVISRSMSIKMTPICLLSPVRSVIFLMITDGSCRVCHLPGLLMPKFRMPC